MNAKILMIIVAMILTMTSLLTGCSGIVVHEQALNAAKVGVAGFQQCRPDLTLKEIGLSDIQTRNEAVECSKKGMPVIFTAELKNRLQERLKKEVVIVPLDIPYNYNIQSQIDLAKKQNVDYLVGGMLERYVDVSATQRAKKTGIMPDTAILSPVMVSGDTSTVLIADLKVARVSDGKIVAEVKWEADGQKGGDVYTRDLADEIAEDLFDAQ